MCRGETTTTAIKIQTKKEPVVSYRTDNRYSRRAWRTFLLIGGRVPEGAGDVKS